MTSWRNGSASDSRSEGCVFKSRRGQILEKGSFHKVAGQFVFDSRNLLKRNLFPEIIEDHLANRSKENVDQLKALSL